MPIIIEIRPLVLTRIQNKFEKQPFGQHALKMRPILVELVAVPKTAWLYQLDYEFHGNRFRQTWTAY
jgi:hypothetical protein